MSGMGQWKRKMLAHNSWLLHIWSSWLRVYFHRLIEVFVKLEMQHSWQLCRKYKQWFSEAWFSFSTDYEVNWPELNFNYQNEHLLTLGGLSFQNDMSSLFFSRNSIFTNKELMFFSNLDTIFNSFIVFSKISLPLFVYQHLSASAVFSHEKYQQCQNLKANINTTAFCRHRPLTFVCFPS